MKITYTKDNTSKAINISKSDLDNKVLVSWSDKSSQMASLELTANGIKEYLQNPKVLLTDANIIYLTVNNDGDLNQPIFRTIETNQTKMGGMEFIKFKLNEITVGQIYIPFKDSSDEEYIVRLNIKDDDVSKLLEVIPDATEVEGSTQGFKDFNSKVLPSLKIVSSSKDGEWTKIKVQLTLDGNNVSKSDVRIFAKSSSGYIANREIYTDENGIAEFKVLPYGLEQGEEMKAEFGFKYYSNVVSKNVVA